MFPYSTNSMFANPALGAAFASLGLKPRRAAITFSVGTQASSPDDYIIKSKVGNLPTATIEYGYITFSVPQSHPYIGIGDKVVLDSGGENVTIYLNEKVSTRRWKVFDKLGNTPDNVETGLEVSTIDKTFSGIRDAINGDTPGAWGLIETYSLIAKNSMLQIACYEMVDDMGSDRVVISDSWFQDIDRRIKIFTPTDITYECNKSQRHKNGRADQGGYRIKTTDTNMIDLFEFTIIDGLILGDDVANPTNGIVCANSAYHQFQILNNVFYNIDNAVVLRPSSGNDYAIVNNVVRDGINGLVLNYCIEGGACFGNTIINCSGDGIGFTTNNNIDIINNIIQDCGTDLNSNGLGISNVFNCISSDGTVGSSQDNVSNTALKFEDKTNKDYRLHLVDTDAYLSDAGQDLSENTRYPIDNDINGDPMDDTWCIGAFHHVPEVAYAIGPVSLDLKTGTPNFSITDSEMLFDGVQTNEMLSAGCVVDDGSSTYLLKRKLADDKWLVTTFTGGVVADDAGPTAVSTINFKANTLYEILNQTSTRFYNHIGTLELYDADLRVKVLCITGSGYRRCEPSVYGGDKTRYLMIYSPDRSNPYYIESNTNRRNNGKWDTLDYISSSTDFPVNTPYTEYGDQGLDAAVNITGNYDTGDYCVLDGIQISATNAGVLVEGVENVRVTNNYIKDCKGAGVKIGGSDSGVDAAKTNQNLIANNTVIRCGGGIEVIHGNEFVNRAYFTVGEEPKRFQIAPNVGIDINHIIRKYTYKIVVSSQNKIEWFPGRVIITVNSGDNMEDVVDSGNVSGIPWGTVTPHLSDSDPLTTVAETRIGDVENVGLTAILQNNISYIYANTIVKCDRGILIDTLPAEAAFTNVAIIRSNLVIDCTYDNYYSSSRWPKTILAEYNWSDDQSIDNFFGSNNVNAASVRFVEPESDDYRIALYDAERMIGLNLASDEFRQITYDNVGTEYESLPFWAIGANTWKYRNKEIHASIGNESGDLGISITTVKVENGILEFTGDVGNSVGIGDRVNYDDGGATYCYLAERGTDNRWLAVDASGDPLTDMTDKTVTSVNRVSNSLEDAISTDITAEFSDISDKDIVSDELNLFLWCYNDSDTVDIVNTVDITGWTQNFFYRLYIQTPWDIRTQSITKQRHDGVYGGYHIESDTSSAKCINIQDNYTVVRGLSIYPNDGDYGIYTADGMTGLIIEHNIIKEAVTGIRVDGASVSSRNYIVGNIVYDTTTGISISHAKALNNTVIGGTIGVLSANATDIVESNICQDSTCFSGPATPRACISSDGTAGTDDGCMSNVALSFVDKTGKDFHLHRSDWHAINRSINFGFQPLPELSSGEITLYPFYRDIDMEILSHDEWSIGADSISGIETIDLIFSLSFGDATNYRVGTSPTVTITDGVAEFSEAQNNDGMGVGDEMDYDSDNKLCYLYSKVSETQWNVRDKFGLAPDDASDVDLNAITRTFVNSMEDIFDDTEAGSIQQFLGDSNNPFLHLRTGRYRINFAVYKSTTPNGYTTIRDFDTGVNDYIRFFTPNNMVTECNTPQVHAGKRDGTDAKAVFKSTTSDPVISLYVPYTVIDGIIIEGNWNNDASAIALYNAYGCKFVNNLIPEPYIGIDTRDRGHDDPDGDSFDGGTRQDGFWDSEFEDDWWRTRAVPGVGEIAVPYYDHVDETKKLTSSSSPKAGDFDYEVNVVLGPKNEAGDEIRFSLVDGGGTNAELIWKGGLEVIEFNSAQINFPWALNREYKFRIVRGGDITSDGLYVDNPAKDDITTLYYLDDFNDGAGVGTNKWIEFSTTYTSWSGTFWVTVKASRWHGFNSLYLWNAGDSAPAKNVGRNYDNVIANNAVYKAEDQGIVSTGSDILYNNTVDEAGGYCYYNKETDVMINNIGNRATDDDFKDGSTAEYCLAGDTSLTVNDDNNNINSYTLDFVDKTSSVEDRDYHLVQGDDQAVWSGARLDGNVDYPFTFDAGRIERLRKWDRGALEYQTKKVVYAVGLGVEDLQTKVLLEDLKYTIAVIDNRSIMTFSTPQTNQSLGIGCEVTDLSNVFSNGCVLIGKISTTQWEVADYEGNYIAERVSLSEVYSIKRVFRNLADALVDFKGSSYLGTSSLSNAGVYVILACYDDDFVGPSLTDTAKLDGCAGDKHHNLKIMVPYDTNTQCNLSQRHDGVYGDGYKFEPNAFGGEELAALYVFQNNYFEVEGLQIASSLDNAHGVHLYDCVGSYIGYNIVRSMQGHGILHEPITNPIDEIINNLVYDCELSGIEIKIQQQEFFSVKVLINNNTIFGCQRGIHVDKPDYNFPAGLLVECNNDIVTDSEYQDFVSQFENNFGRFSLNSCISGDDSSWLFPGLNNISDKYVTFISRTAKNFNLSKLKDGFAVDSAIDLSTSYIHPFFDDISNESRDPGEYDRGAFEVISLIGTGEMGLGPIVTNSVIGIESLIFPTTILYLREPGPPGDLDENFLPHINPFYQFTAIEGVDVDWHINAFLDAQPKTDHITVYVHGGKAFEGTFELQDRYPRNVTIETYPPEAYLGPASHVYDGPVVDDVSKQALLTYQNIKVYSSDGGEQIYLINDSAETTKLKFINSIVQVNYDSIVGAAIATVEVINSEVIYRYGAGIFIAQP